MIDLSFNKYLDIWFWTSQSDLLWEIKNSYSFDSFSSIEAAILEKSISPILYYWTLVVFFKLFLEVEALFMAKWPHFSLVKTVRTLLVNCNGTRIVVHKRIQKHVKTDRQACISSSVCVLCRERPEESSLYHQYYNQIALIDFRSTGKPCLEYLLLSTVLLM